MVRTRLRPERRRSLPEIDATASGEKIPKNGDLRGSRYEKVPSLPSSGSTTKGGRDHVMFPTEIPDHPAPYFKSPPVDFGKLREAPWENPPAPKLTEVQKTAASGAILDDVINDVVQEELTTAAVAVLEENVIKKQADRDIAEFIEEELYMPVLAKECDRVAWKTLDFWIRSYGDDEKFKQAKEIDMPTRVAVQAYARGEKPSSKLRFITWDVLIPHVKRVTQGSGLNQNLALLGLQKTIVTKVATDTLRKSAASSMEAEMKSIEEKEKLSSPPRRG